MKSKDAVAALKDQFPKFSKIQFCNVNHPEYGVDYSAKAKAVLRKNGLLPPAAKKPARRKPNRVVTYLDDETYAQISAAIDRADCTTQEYLERLIRTKLTERSQK